MDDLALDKKIKWQFLLLFYALWGLIVILGFVIFFASRAVFRLLLFDFASKEWISWAWANLFEKIIVVIIGVSILGFIVFAQDYFYKGLEKKLLLKRFARVSFVGLIILFILLSIFSVFAKYAF